MYIPLSDDKHQMVRDNSKKRTCQHRRNSNPVAMLPHAAVVFCMQPYYCSMYIPLSDDKYQMVRDSSKNTGQCRRNSNPVATLPHAAVVFHMQPFN